MPGRPVRRTTDRTVRHIGTPSASEASRSEFGTRWSDSSVVRMTTGSMMIARATLPAKALNCLNGRTRNVNTKIPIRIDGIPTSTSAQKRTIRAERRFPNSAT